VTCRRNDTSLVGELLSHTTHSHFRYFLALFAESFSPVVHTTCALSVLCPYFTLCGAYHTFNLQSQEDLLAHTMKVPSTGSTMATHRAVTHYCMLFQAVVVWRSHTSASQSIPAAPELRAARRPVYGLGVFAHAPSSLAVTRGIPVGFSSSADWYA